MTCKNKNCINNINKHGIKNKCKKSFSVSLDKNGRCKNMILKKDIDEIVSSGYFPKGEPLLKPVKDKIDEIEKLIKNNVFLINDCRSEIFKYLEKIATEIIICDFKIHILLTKKKYKNFLKRKNKEKNHTLTFTDYFHKSETIQITYSDYKYKGYIYYLNKSGVKIIYCIWVKK